MKKGDAGYDYPRPGDRRWSNFFQSNIEMSGYVSDNLYYFRVLSNPKYPPDKVYRNQSPWSTLEPPHDE